MLDIIKLVLYTLLDVHLLRKKEKKGKKITWWDTVLPPTVRLAIGIGIFLLMVYFLLVWILKPGTP